MYKKEINSIDGFEISQLTFENLRIKYGTFQKNSSGSGRNKTYTTRSGCQTEIGDIREDIWCLLAEQLIKKSGEEKILEWLHEYVDSMPWMKKASVSDCKNKALDLHISRIFDNPEWVDFIPFNESHRPEVLHGIEIVESISSCCRKQGRVQELKYEITVYIVPIADASVHTKKHEM